MMNEATALKLTNSKPSRKPLKAKRPVSRKLKTGDVIRASGFATLALCGLGVSLPHLASELGLLTGSADLAAWLIALVVDFGMVACKANLAAGATLARRTVCWSILGSCTGLSILLNCHAFSAHATPGFGQVAAIIFGIFLPLFILALSYLASEIVLGHK